MILYHISSYLDFNGDFKKRIPSERIESENDTILRICAAPTLEQCFASIGCCEGNYKVFKIDTDKLGIRDKDICTPQELYDKGLVPDALFHKEHWITTNFKVSIEDQTPIEVISWEEDFVSFDKKNNSYIPYVENGKFENGIIIFNLNYEIKSLLKQSV